ETPAQDPAASMTSTSAAADTHAVAAVPDASQRPPPVLPAVTAALAYVESAQRTAAQVRSATDQVLALAQGNLAHASVAGIAGHDYRAAITALVASTYALRRTYEGA